MFTKFNPVFSNNQNFLANIISSKMEWFKIACDTLEKFISELKLLVFNINVENSRQSYNVKTFTVLWKRIILVVEKIDFNQKRKPLFPFIEVLEKMSKSKNPWNWLDTFFVLHSQKKEWTKIKKSLILFFMIIKWLGNSSPLFKRFFFSITIITQFFFFTFFILLSLDKL